jgi:hypothetical protein
MLLVIVQNKAKKKYILTKLPDGDMESAIEIATGAMTNGKYKKAFVYISHKGNKPILIKTVRVTWNNKVKVK